MSLKDSGGGAGLDLTAIINATTINVSYSSSLIYNTYDYILFSIGQLGGKTLTVIFNINEGLMLFIGLDPSTTSSRVYNPYAYYGNWQFIHSSLLHLFYAEKKSFLLSRQDDRFIKAVSLNDVAIIPGICYNSLASVITKMKDMERIRYVQTKKSRASAGAATP